MADLAIKPNTQLDLLNTTIDQPLVTGEPTYASVTESVSRIVEDKPTKFWFGLLAVTSSLMLMLFVMLGYLVVTGIGVWGNNIPIAWAWDITNFVWWIGIGHAGTLISAILFLLRQRWRTAINRAAEAMTLFAVACAAIYPVFHTGRPWRAVYWLLPYPNTMQMWLNFRSPLEWDVFAVSTYGTVSLLFWYVGLLPDLATIRDRATGLRRLAYGFFSLGWRGSANHWKHYELAYMVLAGLSTPLVLSVHSIVSFDFATSILPGWHTTIFPPYFVAGAVFSGFGMVLTLLIITRKALGLEHLITLKHIDYMCKVMLATSMIVGYSYATEYFIAWFSAVDGERFAFYNRITGPYAWAAWSMIICNVVAPIPLWWKSVRMNITAVFIITIFVNIGMWFERFVIIAISLHRDFLPSSWEYFHPTYVDICTFLGTIGLFLTLYLFFIKFVPMIAIAEVKGAIAQDIEKGGHH
jgi:molybdopterin-containing oxidoreductase family membrane subunit